MKRKEVFIKRKEAYSQEKLNENDQIYEFVYEYKPNQISLELFCSENSKSSDW